MFISQHDKGSRVLVETNFLCCQPLLRRRPEGGLLHIGIGGGCVSPRCLESLEGLALCELSPCARFSCMIGMSWCRSVVIEPTSEWPRKTW